MIAYKLCKIRKNGSLGPLFINRRMQFPINEWMQSDLVPTKGFAVRQGFHCCTKPIAPHLKLKEDRIWIKVEVEDFEYFERPKSQGGKWVLAQRMKVLGKLKEKI